MAAAVFAALLVYFCSGMVVPVTGDRGFALPSANEWLRQPWLNFGSSVAVNAALLLLAALLNKTYNILRGMTSLYIVLYGVMELATPQLFAQFYTGPVLAIVAATGLYLLYGRYRSKWASGHVFLVMLLLSALTATQYCFAFYIPVFLVVCAQLRVFNGRTAVAAFAGIIAPWWMLAGFGRLTAGSLHLPEIHNIFGGMDTAGIALTLAATGFTCLLLILSIALNVFKTIAYNARSRAVNGALTVTAVFTIAGICVDITNFMTYIPLLNFCASLQTAHYFCTHRTGRSFIPIIAIIVVYSVLYICQTQI